MTEYGFSFRTLLVLTLLCGFFSINAFGLKTTGFPTTQQRREVTVRLVLVDVLATDKDENIVTDLTKQDFEIFEDGKPVPKKRGRAMLTYRCQERYPIIRADILPLKAHFWALKKHFKKSYKNKI